MRAERVVLWWVDRYTRGLAEPIRTERRDELRSDLWEHRAALGNGHGAQLALASRCLRGVPADLSWRLAGRGGRRVPSRGSIARGLGWALAAGASALLVLVHGLVASPLVGLELQGSAQDAEAQLYARVCALLLALLVAGVLLLRRRPRTGATLVGAGALGTPVAFWWGAVLWGPPAVAVTAAAVVLARRRLQARASSATS